VHAIGDAIQFADFLLVMSVNPGFGGQAFIPQAISKIEHLRALASAQEIDISVDGGVSPDNAAALAEAGANTLIAGSEIFGKQNRANAISDLRRRAAGDNS
jgi:ribulose-phosphate 3-epimerase